MKFEIFLENFLKINFQNSSIKILDENDSPPLLDIPKNVVSISEYHDLMNSIIHIKAYDADDPLTLNGKVELTVSGGSGRGNARNNTRNQSNEQSEH